MVKKKNNEVLDEIDMSTEVTPEEIEIEEQEANSNTKIKSLQTKLKACEADKRHQLDDLQRTKAEFLNARKRLEEQKQLDIERSTNAFIIKLLPLCDSFLMAMTNTNQWETVDEGWRKGVESIYQQLNSILASYNVVAVNPKGESFDPEKHEAVSSVDSDATESDIVLEVLQQGYVRNGELIRPATVIISK